MTKWRRWAYEIVLWTFLVLLLAQVFLGGLLAFGAMEYSDWHRVVGYDVIWPVAFVLLLLALVSRLPRGSLLLVVAVFGLTSVLPFLPSLRSISRFLSALHPATAFLVFGLVVVLAIQTLGPRPAETVTAGP